MTGDDFDKAFLEARARTGKARPPSATARPNGKVMTKASPPDGTNSFESEIRRLAKLSPLEYEAERKVAAKRLNIRSATLDNLVSAERGTAGDGKQGRALSLPEPEPWPNRVSGADLLDALSAAIRRHVVMSGHAADTAALWIVHTYLLDLVEISPRLAITSPEKQCGKSTLLDVLERLAWRPLPTSNVTAASVFRIVEKQRPTLLIDEADTFLAEKEELRGILNSGHHPRGSVIRTVGDDHEPRQFSTYAACAIALIGKLPDTLANRSVAIELRRRLPDEPIEGMRIGRTGHLDELSRKVARWTTDNMDRIKVADPEMPSGIFNRAADNWGPLLAIADAAGGEWPARARRAALVAETAALGDEQSVKVQLLADIRVIFSERGVDRLPSAELVESLGRIEGRPWAEWKAGKTITANGLARLLAPFGVTPDTIRVGDRTMKGYLLARFEDDVFKRYLPQQGAQSVTP
jgi:putative DNA primase/helicase